ncbi:MAG TPA: complex I subunit 5 family protein [Acidimicrobiales bacterium]|nr:complex I subunit 5 family protein [Acidimicrobiales bacterium]
MPVIPPLTVAVPLAFAAFLAATGSLIPRRAVTLTAIGAAAATTALQFAQLVQSLTHDLNHWFGGWTPQHHYALGILFTVDPIDAILACVVGVLMLASLSFSWWGIRDVSHLYYALMLAFLGGMAGFALSADLFDIFVFFELMSVTGYGLCSFRQTSSSVMQGALNFAIMNSIGAFFILMGISLIYGRTGSLNLAQISVSLRGTHPDMLVVVSFVFILVGFLTKAGAVPFHFWMSDAYAVAAAPVGALYAGIMSDLGYHAIARIYADGYAATLDSVAPSVSGILIGVGVATAVVGAVMCFGQADVKRQMAFLVISHGGIFLCGIGLLTGAGMAGATLYVAADAMIKGAVFLTIGYVVVTLGASDEFMLRGRGRRRRHLPAGLAFGLAGLGFAAVPGFGPWLSASLIQQSADAAGYTWLPPVLVVATAVTAATLLRSGGRIFLGWGGDRDPLLTSAQPDEPEEGEPQEESRISTVSLLPAGALLVAGFGMAFAPHLAGYATQAGRQFLDLPGYVAEVIHGRYPPPVTRLPAFHPTAGSWAYGAATTAGALGLAAASLAWSRARTHGLLTRVVLPPLRVLKAVHSGRIGDMATWLTVGAVALCAAGAVTLR